MVHWKYVYFLVILLVWGAYNNSTRKTIQRYNIKTLILNSIVKCIRHVNLYFQLKTISWSSLRSKINTSVTPVRLTCLKSGKLRVANLDKSFHAIPHVFYVSTYYNICIIYCKYLMRMKYFFFFMVTKIINRNTRDSCGCCIHQNTHSFSVHHLLYKTPSDIQPSRHSSRPRESCTQ